MLRFLQEYLAKCLPSNWHCLINTPCDPFFNWKRQIQTEKKTGIKNSVCYIDLQVLIFFWKYLCPIVTNPCKFYEEVIHEGMGRGRRGRVCASSNTFNIPFSCLSINEMYQLISHHLLLDPRRQRRKNSHSR